MYVKFISVKLPHFAVAQWKKKEYDENGIVQAYFKS